MIKRLYVDNYKCFVNFEYRPKQFQLLYGNNGTGKSTTFEVFSLIRQLVTWGGTTEQVIPGNTLTMWQTRPEQIFEIDIEDELGVFHYRLIIEHNRSIGKNRIKNESLKVDDTILYEFDGQDAHLYRNDGSAGPVFPLDWSRSGISTIPERQDNTSLCRFRLRLGLIYTLSIDPRSMEFVSIQEQSAPTPNLSNFASWYRHLTQDSPETMGGLFESLQEVIDGFTNLKLFNTGGTTRVLQACFSHEGANGEAPHPYELALNQLSDGQRCLVALYTILHCAVKQGFTLCIDEPDNFVALPELQPWLEEIRDQVEEQNSQCLLISHHPELLDRLAVGHGVRFRREESGPVRINDVKWPDDGLRPSEIIAREWEE